MSLTRRSTALAAALISCAVPAAMAQTPSSAEPPGRSHPSDFTSIVSEMTPAVVAITATRTLEREQAAPNALPSPFGSRTPGARRPHQGRALGSGFLIDDRGYIVTNNHVVERASDIKILAEDGGTQAAELVGTDPATDIAVLKIGQTGDLEAAHWGDSDDMHPGAWTIAIGSPFGLGGTVTVGVLSATSRDIRSGPYDNFLQTDASINRGNSGGPLFNAAGEVVGVNTAIFSPVGANIGIGFAVPSNTARNVVEQLIKTGKVERGFIGVRLQAVTEDIARALKLDSHKGALVSEVETGSPAASAGLSAGDVIAALNGETVEDARELSRKVGQTSPGTEITLTVTRDGKTEDVPLTLAERQPAEMISSTGEGDLPEQGQMGLAVAQLPEILRRQLDLDEGTGLMVQRVKDGSPADQAGLKQGDVILRSGGDAIRSARDLSAAWQTARKEERPVLLKITREGTARFVAVDTKDG